MTTVADRTERRTVSDRFARLVTEVFAPAVFAALMPLIIALHASPSVVQGFGWGVLTLLFSAAIPYGMVWLGVRRGRLTDHHIGVREQRRTPVILGLVSVLAGLVALILLRAPRPLVAMVVVMFAVLLIVGAVNQVWKLSAHAAVAAGSVAVLTVAFGRQLLASAAVVALIGWSRVRLRDHTTAQVITGALVGAVIAGPTFAVLG